MGGRGTRSGMTASGGGVTPTSMPNSSMETIQKFVDQFGTGMSVSDMVSRVYRALPNTGQTFRGVGGVIQDNGASIVNGRYLQMDDGTTYQFIRQKSQGTWKVKKI